MCEKKPDIILFTGFLGSGKTTMLLKTIELLAAENKKCAIIVNEIGEVGIDNRQMRRLGYDVHDLFGGCVLHAEGNPGGHHQPSADRIRRP